MVKGGTGSNSKELTYVIPYRQPWPVGNSLWPMPIGDIRELSRARTHPTREGKGGKTKAGNSHPNRLRSVLHPGNNERSMAEPANCVLTGTHKSTHYGALKRYADVESLITHDSLMVNQDCAYCHTIGPNSAQPLNRSEELDL